MSEAAQTEVKTVPIGELNFQDFKQAREKGLTAVPADGDPAKETPKQEPSDAPERAAKPDSDSETEHDESETQRKKGKGGFQRTIDKLKGQIYELSSELDKAKQHKLADKPAEAKVEEPSKPKAENFTTYEDFVEALTDWKAEQKRVQWQAQEASQRQDDAMRQVLDTYAKRTTEAKAKYEDFDEVVSDSTIQIPQGVHLAILELENGPEVAYYLGNNPEVCQKLLEMSQVRAVAEIGRISDKLTPSEEHSPEKPVSAKPQAPEPIKPVGTRSTKSSVPLGEMPFADFVKARAAGRQA